MKRDFNNEYGDRLRYKGRQSPRQARASSSGKILAWNCKENRKKISTATVVLCIFSYLHIQYGILSSFYVTQSQ